MAHGTANAKKVMDDIKAGGKFSECHFIEFMACPGGCLGGGGQPIPTNPRSGPRAPGPSTAKTRPTTCASRTRTRPCAQTYAEFLTDGPCGHKSHELLHTTYTARGKYIPQK